MKLGYVVVYVKDPELSAMFWERAFGLARRFTHESGQYVEMETGAATLAFASLALGQEHGLALSAHDPAGPAAACEVVLVTEELSAAWSKAVAAGATPVSPPEAKPWGQTVAWLRDPEGVLVELCTPIAG